MVSKHLELVKKKGRDRYGRFRPPSSRTAPPSSLHEVGSSSRRRTAPPLLHLQEVGSYSSRRTAPPPSFDSDDSMEMWVAAPPPLRLPVAPPLTHLAPPPPPPTRVEECPHIKGVRSYKNCFYISIV
jgi:hypothetical protein